MSTSASKRRILIVDDEQSARDGLAQLFRHEGFDVTQAEDGRVAMGQLDELPFDVVVTDIKMPHMDGLEPIAEIKKRLAATPVILMTAFADIETAVAGMRAGAYHFVTKPIDFDALILTVERSLETQRLKSTVETLRNHLDNHERTGSYGLLGTSEPVQRMHQMAKRVAPARATVMITGESGTGKGVLARAIHQMGPRQNQPFLTLNCTAVADTLLESELFGHEKGAFTGADRRRIGRFEQAEGGTLFLDEVGEIPLSTQVKLLRILQDREFERVGGNETLHTSARVIAATNRDLREAVDQREFREDLFYRLNVVHIPVPPLRSRGNDILLLANRFLSEHAANNNRTIEGFSNAANRSLLEHPWPGNVRELENAIEHAVVLCEGERIEASDLPIGTARQGQGQRMDSSGPPIPGSSMAELERYAIEQTLAHCGGSTARTARILGISVRTIQYRLQNYRSSSAAEKVAN